MAAPATSPLFATDSVFTADGDTWSGDAVRLDPGSTRRAEGFEPDLLPCEWLNFVIGNHGDWIKHLSDSVGGDDGTAEWEYQDGPRRRHRVIPLSSGFYADDGAGVQTWNRTIIAATNWRARPLVNSTRAIFPIVLPTGAEVVAIKIWLSTSTGRTGTDRFTMALYSQALDLAAAYVENAGAIIGSAIDDGGGTGYTQRTLTQAVTISPTDTLYWLEIKGPLGSLASTDYLSLIRLTWDAVGPAEG